MVFVFSQSFSVWAVRKPELRQPKKKKEIKTKIHREVFCLPEMTCDLCIYCLGSVRVKRLQWKKIIK